MNKWNLLHEELDKACLESNKIGKLIFNIKEEKNYNAHYENDKNLILKLLLQLVILAASFWGYRFLNKNG